MHNIFSFRRFARLFYKHSTEHYKSYGMSVVVLLGIMILGGAFLVYMVDVPLDENVQSVLFMVVLLLAGTIFTSTVFADLGDSRKSIPWLMLPATHFEKYLVAWIYTVILFLAVYTAVFYSILLIAVHIRNFPGHTIRILNVFQKPVVLIFLLYAFLHSIAFWGAIFFKRLHFIKTGFAFFIYFALLVWFNKVLLGFWLGRQVAAAPPFGSPHINLQPDGSYTDISIKSNMQDAITISLLAVVALIFWIAAFYRLKEKEA